jgi:outer membrane protein assembly factor BamB
VVYHVTNAGLVAALEVRSGEVIWLTRYPQNIGILDNLRKLPSVWRNERPLLRGEKLYVTPVDSDHLLCLDRTTGKILWAVSRSVDSGQWESRRSGRRFPGVWHMAGFGADGTLCLTGSDLVFLDPDTGKLVRTAGLQGFLPRGKAGPSDGKMSALIRKKAPKGLEPAINSEGTDFWWHLGRIMCPPTLTANGKVYFSMQQTGRRGRFNSEFVYDLKSASIERQRRWFGPEFLKSLRGLSVMKRPVNEAPEAFDPAMRMVFEREAVPFEIDVTCRHIVVRFGKKETKEN